jgi:hypothetical protein
VDRSSGAPRMGSPGSRVPVGVGAAPATSLLAASQRGRSRTTLATKIGTGSWARMTSFPGKRAEVVTGVGPSGTQANWLLGGRSGAASECELRPLGDPCWGVPAIWLSLDGAVWTKVQLSGGQGVAPETADDSPVQVTEVTSLIASSRGYVAVGAEFNPWVGARHDTWVSDDGQAWARLEQLDVPTFDYGPGLVAEGPAGVIGLSGSNHEKQLVVWQLR